MSATIPSNKQLDDLLKPTGFDCPENLKGKTFHEATSGGGGPTKIYGWINEDESFVITDTLTPKVGDKVFWNGDGFNIIAVSADNKITVKSNDSETTWIFERYPSWDFEF